jgi:hypothetical protein
MFKRIQLLLLSAVCAFNQVPGSRDLGASIIDRPDEQFTGLETDVRGSCTFIAVGVGKFLSPMIPNLTAAPFDAKRLSIAAGGELKCKTILLNDWQTPERLPTKSNFMRLTSREIALAPQSHTVFVYLGTHGTLIQNQLYLILRDTETQSITAFRNSLVSEAELDSLERPDIHLVYLLDVCRTGAAPRALTKFYATKLHGSSWEAGGRGIYADALEKGIRGAAFEKGVLTLGSLDRYLSAFVPAATMKISGGAAVQHPEASWGEIDPETVILGRERVRDDEKSLENPRPVRTRPRVRYWYRLSTEAIEQK